MAQLVSNDKVIPLLKLPLEGSVGLKKSNLCCIALVIFAENVKFVNAVNMNVTFPAL